MKKLLSLLLVLSQIVPASTLAAISVPDRADIPAPINAVTNSSGQRGLAGWVKGGTPTFSVVTTTGNKAQGSSSFSLDAASSSDYVETAALTLTDDTTGDCEASVSVKGNGTGYTFQLMSGASVLYSMALTNNTGFKTHAFNYPCDAGYKLRIASSGDGAAINFGAVYWGKATNLGAINPITDWVSYTPTITNGGTTSAVSGRWRRIGDSMHVQIEVAYTGPGAAAPVQYSAPFPFDNTKMAIGSPRQILGTGTWLDSGVGLKSFNIANGPTNTVYLHVHGAGSEQNGVELANGDRHTLEFMAPVQGWTAQTVYNAASPTVTDWGTCPSAVTLTAASGGLSLGTSGVAEYKCKRDGDTAHVQYRFVTGGTGMSGGTGDFNITVPYAVDINKLTGTDTANGAGWAYNTGSGPGFVNFNHRYVGSNKFKLQIDTSPNGYVLSTTAFPLILSSVGHAVIGSFSFPVVGWTSSAPVPLLVGSVTSNTSGMERVERLRFGGASAGSNCTASPCTLQSQSGSWATGVTRAGLGIYSVAFASGMFSSAPVCVCSGVASGVGYVACSVENPSTTGTVVFTFTRTGSPLDMADTNVQLICMGPR